MSNVFKVPEGELHGDSSPDNLEGWDSLAHMMLVAALEEEFDVVFEEQEIPKLTSKNAVVGLVRKKTGSAKPA